MNDHDRIETTEERDGETYHALLGQTGAGGLLLVVWIDHPSWRYPVHAHRAGRREAREVLQVTSERHHRDPYEGMTEAELDTHFAELFDRRERTVPVTLRMPEELLRRTERLAEARRIPYQRLIKQILDAAISHIERRARSESGSG